MTNLISLSLNHSPASCAPADAPSVILSGLNDDGFQYNWKTLHLPVGVVVMDSPLCTQSAGVTETSSPSVELEPMSPRKIKQNTAEESDDVRVVRHKEAEMSIENEEAYQHTGNLTCWQSGVSVPSGEDAAGKPGMRNAAGHRLDEHENMPITIRDNSVCVVPDDKKFEFLLSERPQKTKHQTQEHKTFAGDGSSRSQKSVHGSITSTENVDDQIKQETHAEDEKAAVNSRYVWGYFVGKLSDAYKDAHRRLQETRDIIRNVGVGEMKTVFSHCVTMVSKELPPIPRMQVKPQPEICRPAERKVCFINLLKDQALSSPQNTRGTVIAALPAWPGGSVSSSRDKTPEVFHQRLVQMPPVLAHLQACSPTEMLKRLEYLSPQEQVARCLSIFWVKTATVEEPIPKPGCLLLSERDIRIVSTGTDSEDTLAVYHHFNLLEIKRVQISLAGQHVRLSGAKEDAILAIFTHSKELTQEFCKALLKAVAPERFSRGTESHPLLSGDLTVLSLDWTSTVPDIILDSGLHVTSRFKRVLADLLYIVHGNMDGPGKPSLADVCPLLYTSAKVMNSTRVHQDAIFHFLLTDMHVALLLEDGVFHPVPRGSTLVPVQPQFQGLELRRRSDIRRLTVGQKESCLVVDMVFSNDAPPAGQQGDEQQMLSSANDDRHRCLSWKLCFGCTSDAVLLINHLCA